VLKGLASGQPDLLVLIVAAAKIWPLRQVHFDLPRLPYWPTSLVFVKCFALAYSALVEVGFW
jgi:hypothetical protein